MILSYFSLIPSVCLVVDIPKVLNHHGTLVQYWWGSRMQLLKHQVLNVMALSFDRDILVRNSLHTQPILYLYTDGGPDHRLAYLSVQLSLINIIISIPGSRFPMCSKDTTIS